MGEAVLFYLASTLAVASSLLVVTVPRPMHSILSLVGTMFCLAVLFVLLHAYFIAVIHLLVYGGAILVLFLFVVMLLGLAGREEGTRGRTLFRIFGGVIVAAFLAQLAYAVKWLGASGTALTQPGQGTEGTIEAVGRLLFTRYLLPFELTSILLLVGILGAVVLARKESS